jgi:hypothetical protein
MKARQQAPFDQDQKRLELLRRLNEIPGVDLPEDGINRRPSISLGALVDSNAFESFVGIMEWAIEEVKTA